MEAVTWGHGEDTLLLLGAMITLSLALLLDAVAGPRTLLPGSKGDNGVAGGHTHSHVKSEWTHGSFRHSQGLT